MIRFVVIRSVLLDNLTFYLPEFILKPTEISKKSQTFGKNCKKFKFLGKKCKNFKVFGKMGEKIQSFWKNLQNFGKNCRNLKNLASFLLLLI